MLLQGLKIFFCEYLAFVLKPRPYNTSVAAQTITTDGFLVLVPKQRSEFSAN